VLVRDASEETSTRDERDSLLSADPFMQVKQNEIMYASAHFWS
jgi:hypothetical protein